MLYNVDIHIKGIGNDTYMVGADDIYRAALECLRRVREEADYTDFEIVRITEVKE